MKRSKCYDLILNLDILSYNPQLAFNGDNQYKSLIGLLLSIIAGSVIVGFGIYFFIDLIEGKEVIIVSSKLTHFDSTVRFKDITFAFRLMNENMEPIPRDIAVIEPYVNELDYVNEARKRIKPKLVPCTEDDFIDHEKIEDFEMPNPSDYLCFDFGDWDDPRLVEEQSRSIYLNIPIAKCRNDTEIYFNYTQCKPYEEIDAYFDEHEIYFEHYITENVNIC